MSEFNDPEMLWVAAHGNELIGQDAEAAAARVREAGFRPVIKIPRPGTAFASAYWGGSVSLVCVDGVVSRVSAG